ncbi:hypothetical protein [Blastopirellula marina]|uniref:Beta-hexosaminidase bacterial type N-terminal domain-containing protein n=1 Tax=Blastopirellula marina TaxID=124 RepID=A0A2S8GLP7_9BACT|nr:hypothetical protein [Blastopirellula marina]PQO45363.1 hypothetical protein C5Y93_12945 [Blastopirellula marina]
MLPTTCGRSCQAIFACLAVLIFLSCSSNGADQTAPETTQWVLPVATSKANANLDAQLTRLKDVLQNKFEIQYHENGNPGCALWVEVTGFKPNPGVGGYVIVIQPGGIVLTATDAEQLERAIERIKQVRQVKKDGVYLPVGLLTNYPVIESTDR